MTAFARRPNSSSAQGGVRPGTTNHVPGYCSSTGRARRRFWAIERRYQSRIRQLQHGHALECCDGQRRLVQRPSVPGERHHQLDSRETRFQVRRRLSGAAHERIQLPTLPRPRSYGNLGGAATASPLASETAGTGTPSLGATTVTLRQARLTLLYGLPPQRIHRLQFSTDLEDHCGKPRLSADRFYRRSQYPLLDFERK